MKCLIIYYSKTGNTKKVSDVLFDFLKTSCEVLDYHDIEGLKEADFYKYDLICLGFPSYMWRPPKEVDDFVRNKYAEYNDQGKVKLKSPRNGKKAFVFCTYSGPHTGKREAIPAVKYVGQYFDHLGFRVKELCVVGEFHNDTEASTKGYMGNIKGRPDKKDLAGAVKALQKFIGA
jgi:flavodoxin